MLLSAARGLGVSRLETTARFWVSTAVSVMAECRALPPHGLPAAPPEARLAPVRALCSGHALCLGRSPEVTSCHTPLCLESLLRCHPVSETSWDHPAENVGTLLARPPGRLSLVCSLEHSPHPQWDLVRSSASSPLSPTTGTEAPGGWDLLGFLPYPSELNGLLPVRITARAHAAECTVRSQARQAPGAPPTPGWREPQLHAAAAAVSGAGLASCDPLPCSEKQWAGWPLLRKPHFGFCCSPK